MGSTSETLAAWLPGRMPPDVQTELDTRIGQGLVFDWRFPERLDPACRLARKLLLERQLGLPQLAGLRVRIHPALLGQPGNGLDNWLDEPALNRLPALLWLFGPATDRRCMRSRNADGEVLQLSLRHLQAGRYSWLQVVLSEGCTLGGEPHCEDSLELGGSDGFLHVHGILGPRGRQPRLRLQRGAHVHIRRDLPDWHGKPTRLRPRAAQMRIADYLELCRSLPPA